MENNTNTVSNTTILEGQSTARPPLFNGMNYNYWATRMRIYIQTSSYETWNIMQFEYTIPTTEYSTWSNACLLYTSTLRIRL